MDQMEEINIHDFATFEKEQHLLPEFKNSIRQKQRATIPIAGSKNKLFQQVGRKPSFQEIAKTVQAVEKVLIRWPRRSRSHHHSSSSEDDLDENVSCSDKKKEKVDTSDIAVEIGEKSSPDDEGSSVHTTTSDIANTDDSNPVTPAKQTHTDAASHPPPLKGQGDGGEQTLHDQTVLSPVVKAHAHDSDVGYGAAVDAQITRPITLGSATILVKKKKGSHGNQPAQSSSDQRCPRCVIL